MYEGNIAHSQSTNYKTKDEQHDVFIHTSFRFMFWEYFLTDENCLEQWQFLVITFSG